MRVKEIMDSKHQSIHKHELATKARALIRDFDLRILPVTDENGKLLGKISRRDIMAISSSISAIRVEGIMTPARHIATVDDEVYSAIKQMLQVDAWYAPVVSNNNEKIYCGVLGLESFIEPLMKTNPEKFLKDTSEIMTKNVLTCSPEDEVDNIWRLMREKRLAGLPVIKNGKLVGIVTQKDLLESGAILPAFESSKGRFRDSTKILSVMETNIVAAKPSVKIIKVARLMVSKNIGRVPVIDEGGKLIGIVDREDIARLLIK
ncbi:CBS domain-containing protein [Candidatus Bathyarchaeota archaeon]|nr:CBS domain-containing protein [Candidatus Bathyarchaeota archaeon]